MKQTVRTGACAFGATPPRSASVSINRCHTRFLEPGKKTKQKGIDVQTCAMRQAYPHDSRIIRRYAGWILGSIEAHINTRSTIAVFFLFFWYLRT